MNTSEASEPIDIRVNETKEVKVNQTKDTPTIYNWIGKPKEIDDGLLKQIREMNRNHTFLPSEGKG